MKSSLNAAVCCLTVNMSSSHTDVKHAWIISRSPARLLFLYADTRHSYARVPAGVFAGSRARWEELAELWEERAGHRALIRPNLQVKERRHTLILSFHLYRSPSSLPLVFDPLLFCLCGLENVQPPSPPLPHCAFFLSFYQLCLQRQIEQTLNPPSIRLNVDGMQALMIP